MYERKQLYIAFVIVLVFAFSISGGVRAQSHTDSAAVAVVVQGFHDALSNGDSSAALDLLTPDVVIVESGGIENLEHYRTGHLIADMGYAQAINRQSGPMRVVVEGNVAWASSTASATGEVRGREVNSTSAELVVLSRIDGTWKIRAVHWSSRRNR